MEVSSWQISASVHRHDIIWYIFVLTLLPWGAMIGRRCRHHHHDRLLVDFRWRRVRHVAGLISVHACTWHQRSSSACRTRSRPICGHSAWPSSKWSMTFGHTTRRHPTTNTLTSPQRISNEFYYSTSRLVTQHIEISVVQCCLVVWPNAIDHFKWPHFCLESARYTEHDPWNHVHASVGDEYFNFVVEEFRPLSFCEFTCTFHHSP